MVGASAHTPTGAHRHSERCQRISSAGERRKREVFIPWWRTPADQRGLVIQPDASPQVLPGRHPVRNKGFQPPERGDPSLRSGWQFRL